MLEHLRTEEVDIRSAHFTPPQSLNGQGVRPAQDHTFIFFRELRSILHFLLLPHTIFVLRCTRSATVNTKHSDPSPAATPPPFPQHHNHNLLLKMSSSSTSSSPEPEKVIFTSIDDGTVQWDKRFTFAVPPPHIWVDRRIGDELTDLYREMTLLSKAYFAADLQPWLAAEGISGLARKLANAGELTRIMGAVAVGGPEGHESWWQLFADRKMRMHLVVGVIWRVLREHVFHAYLFGGTEEQVRRLRVMDGEEQKSEG